MRKKIGFTLLLGLICIGLFVWIGYKVKTMLNGNSLISLSITQNSEIEETPIEISKIQRIGEWEFLSIKTEELVDSIKKGFFFDDHMACIYQGTLSLGINMKTFNEQWILAQKADSISLLLPPITLLDQDFINEAKTNVFIEEGTWTEKEKEELYQKARKRMQQRACSQENRAIAEKHASAQISHLLRTMGFTKIHLSFRKE